ncbi:fructose-bisphosphate aldolase [Stappia aggregata IAM 12614]|uniref:Fructose-bisphosphate aldolase n=1 Tax=Roseibium aggregatum (strain ATCC 25650 / DSM 13394 / JCM 20685 / NBRC 16684 / NCIMB 2208 / IAM 12614 / B1) TaxID=384765 RepID=A0NNF6_ROSAI|nr:fructose-bisphosphate aldolase [Stappia aggregata IAM 12614] [Roseibium aggregatum IAM 12614]
MRISLALELGMNVVEVRQETDFGQIRSSVRDPAETFANIGSPV